MGKELTRKYHSEMRFIKGIGLFSWAEELAHFVKCLTCKPQDLVDPGT